MQSTNFQGTFKQTVSDASSKNLLVVDNKNKSKKDYLPKKGPADS